MQSLHSIPQRLQDFLPEYMHSMHDPLIKIAFSAPWWITGSRLTEAPMERHRPAKATCEPGQPRAQAGERRMPMRCFWPNDWAAPMQAKRHLPSSRQCATVPASNPPCTGTARIAAESTGSMGRMQGCPAQRSCGDFPRITLFAWVGASPMNGVFTTLRAGMACVWINLQPRLQYSKEGRSWLRTASLPSTPPWACP